MAKTGQREYQKRNAFGDLNVYRKYVLRMCVCKFSSHFNLKSKRNVTKVLLNFQDHVGRDAEQLRAFSKIYNLSYIFLQTSLQ